MTKFKAALMCMILTVPAPALAQSTNTAASEMASKVEEMKKRLAKPEAAQPEIMEKTSLAKEPEQESATKEKTTAKQEAVSEPETTASKPTKAAQKSDDLPKASSKPELVKESAKSTAPEKTPAQNAAIAEQPKAEMSTSETSVEQAAAPEDKTDTKPDAAEKSEALAEVVKPQAEIKEAVETAEKKLAPASQPSAPQNTVEEAKAESEKAPVEKAKTVAETKKPVQSELKKADLPKEIEKKADASGQTATATPPAQPQAKQEKEVVVEKAAEAPKPVAAGAEKVAETASKPETAATTAETTAPEKVAADTKPADVTTEEEAEKLVEAEPEQVDPFNDTLKQALQDAVSALPKTKNFLKKRDNAALVSFYKERDFAPAWLVDGALSPHAQSLIALMANADDEGLNPQDYVTPSADISRTSGASVEELAQAELQIALALTQYTRHAYAGRVDPRRFSKKEITIKPHLPDSIDALKSLHEADDASEALLAFHPQHKGYKALRSEYNRLRNEVREDNSEPVPAGKSLKVGMRSERVLLVRKKLSAPIPTENADVYDKDLSKLVKEFQRSNGLIADGIAGKATLSAMNNNREDLVNDILANMERWRWLPRELGRFHVFVNIPTFHVQISKDDQKIHETRVVVGKRRNKTPVFSDQMEYLVVNPYWNVPKSIASKELLPKIKSDPAKFFSSKNYQVLASVKGRTRVVDPAQLDWSKIDAKQVRLRQTPGTRNALGRIKFMFPNRHAVYLHDTPSRSLFNRDYRAFSHGCVRVHKPLEFADVILSETQKWDAKRVKRMIGGSERRVNLQNKIPVHLAYFTTWMGDDGTLQIRSDIYGHNKKLKKMLGL